MHPIRISANRRYFVDPSGRPVFWLGTTRWQLFREFTVEETRLIVEKSRAAGFDFIQVMLLGVGDGTKPNLHGDMPCHNDDPGTPSEAYFRNVDAVMEIDVAISMTVFHQRYRERTTLEKARGWARWLAQRYGRFPNLVWSMTPRATAEFVPILRELAAGLREGDGGAHLITFKPDPARGQCEQGRRGISRRKGNLPAEHRDDAPPRSLRMEGAGPRSVGQPQVLAAGRFPHSCVRSPPASRMRQKAWSA